MPLKGEPVDATGGERDHGSQGRDFEGDADLGFCAQQ